MRPILMKGHSRSLTTVKYNSDGDIIATGSKDGTIVLWWADNGERFGVLKGHSGMIYSFDITPDSNYLISGAADTTVKFWDLSNGKEMGTQDMKAPVRCVRMNYGATQLAVVTGSFKRILPALHIFDIDWNTFTLKLVSTTDLASTGRACVWLPENEAVLVANEAGELIMMDSKSSEIIKTVSAHSNEIRFVDVDESLSLLLTCSADHNAKIWSLEDLSLIQTLKSDRPVNSGCFAPKLDHVIIGGGQEASDVTTAAEGGNFEAKIWNYALGVEMGQIKGHFGPINALSFDPSGKGYVSGGEDGYIRLHVFDEDYYTLDKKFMPTVEYSVELEKELEAAEEADKE
eukprot:TRINITY_DN64_c0_g2_i1.p1 TRINITY_DN64_c0_g2~~TRINITY_DN64_c0_g2_i1.p1  ORF type:complete len:360 (-),score=104.83 TRINITY_DN64_c0_g2_i1:121-1155(-)